MGFIGPVDIGFLLEGSALRWASIEGCAGSGRGVTAGVITSAGVSAFAGGDAFFAAFLAGAFFGALHTHGAESQNMHVSAVFFAIPYQSLGAATIIPHWYM